MIGARIDRLRNVYGLNMLRGIFLLFVSTGVAATIYVALKPCMEMFVELSCLRHADNKRSVADMCISQCSPLSNRIGILGGFIIAGCITTTLCAIGRYACAWFTDNPYRLLDIYIAARKYWNTAIYIGYFATCALSFVTMGAAMIL